jgi:hypothetical protein
MLLSNPPPFRRPQILPKQVEDAPRANESSVPYRDKKEQNFAARTPSMNVRNLLILPRKKTEQTSSPQKQLLSSNTISACPRLGRFDELSYRFKVPPLVPTTEDKNTEISSNGKTESLRQKEAPSDDETAAAILLSMTDLPAVKLNAAKGPSEVLLCSQRNSRKRSRSDEGSPSGAANVGTVRAVCDGLTSSSGRSVTHPEKTCRPFRARKYQQIVPLPSFAALRRRAKLQQQGTAALSTDQLVPSSSAEAIDNGTKT